MNPDTSAAIKNLLDNDESYVQIAKACDRCLPKKALILKMQKISTVQNKDNVDWSTVYRYFTEME